MVTLSKLHDKCEKCEQRDNCDDKRMVACAIAERSQPITCGIGLSNTMPLAQPFARKHTPIIINMGEYGAINTSMEEIAEQLKKNLYKDINCAFNKS
ncbi:hypothetical protein [Clostridium estertheticum]|uniref:hypothetical protein n=1 Tax=Clostridium estertheticum TaxID=238834 RepID=UPI001C0CF232|nr:hypothetical protein [Clostridium estertheticum]MBU3171363.1 hypothetical protein [Clostridium estertheticum]